MKISVKRIFKGDSYTIGKLYLDGKHFCETIEDPVRELPVACPDTSKGKPCRCKGKIHSQTAIPAGTYKVTMQYSPRFKRVLPYLHDVPHFLGILIHAGNTAEASSGCLILGRNTVKGKVLESKVTLDSLISKIRNEKNITIEIT